MARGGLGRDVQVGLFRPSSDGAAARQVGLLEDMVDVVLHGDALSASRHSIAEPLLWLARRTIPVMGAIDLNSQEPIP